MEVVAHVLPFKTNSYVVEELIDWGSISDDPIFTLTFPQKDLLLPRHFSTMQQALAEGGDKKQIASVAHSIRMELNPHPAGQKEYNVPKLQDGTPLPGLQHKYRDTVLFFPSQGQTCHAYCSFCFRWPQFVGMAGLKFAAREADTLVRYVRENPEVTDVLFTGGDPMIMSGAVFSQYVSALVDAQLPNLRNIRIGSKALSYWPYKFTTDDDADQTLKLFEGIVRAGIHLSFMAHFNHPRELSTRAVEEAISRIRSTGAVIRTQSPLLRNINAQSALWAEMWRRQVRLGCIPYYMFVARDTGAQHYFAVPLVEAQQIFRDAYSQVSGLCRTVRGPSMSALPGKVQVLGTCTIGPGSSAEDKALVLRFIRGRSPAWVHRPFLARYDEKAIWLDDLRPLSGEKFFYEDELNQILQAKHEDPLASPSFATPGPP